jgi:outer membrane cobalamin receptor
MKKVLLVLVLMLAAVVQAATAQEAQITTLKEVVVTATKKEKELQDVTQPVTVITAEEIAKSGATNVATAIQNAAGVHIGDYGTPGSVASASIRGAQSAQILVLMNGIRLNSSRDGGFDLSFIPVAVEDIERIEIVRGPGSALYGADAVGGVINIITRKASANQSTLKGAAGSHGYDNRYLANSGRQEEFSYSVSGSRETSDGYRENSDLDQWIVGGRAGYDFSKTASIEVTANYLDKEWGSPGSTVFGTTPHARQRDRNAVYGASYSGKISSSIQVKLSGYLKQDTLAYEDPDTIDFMTMLSAPTFNRYETESSGGDLQVSWLVASWNQLTAGYELRGDTLDSFDAQLGAAHHAASLKAYYVQDEINIGEPLIIVIGGRNDDHSVFGDKFSPKASARYYIKGTETIIRASYGKSFRAPTFNDLYFNTSWGVGNPNLRPESAKEYDAGGT